MLCALADRLGPMSPRLETLNGRRKLPSNHWQTKELLASSDAGPDNADTPTPNRRTQQKAAGDSR